MLTTLLNRIAPPNHARDYSTVDRVARELKGLLLIPAGGLVAGIYGVTFWSLKPGRVLVEIAAAAIVVGLVHAGAIVHRLCQEMASRAFFRSKRLALPTVLADGITAAERMDAPKTAEAISLRLRKMKEFNIHSVQIFDCLMFDLLESHPDLTRDLRQIAMAAQEKPKL